jgi:eukaryotic-like serine/threonine-protein kinase
MQPERWRQIQNIFLDAAELQPADASTYLDRVCAHDKDLRSEVDRLLAADRDKKSDLGGVVGLEVASFAAAAAQPAISHVGRRIGPYSIVRELGHGGMGAVYQAIRADDQYQGSVAIKFIAGGLDTPEALTRFRNERQILATLQHPNIASLLDGGATEEGHPYIVMEYIDGQPVVDYCKTKNLTVAQRLEVFSAICAAVHHAHQMLVIHRDIKPANVLVTANGIPKLLDFGIAKLLGREVEPGVEAVTQTVHRRLTPQYASPEQIRGESLTTATDIYSLGVLLYEMLTFTSPYSIAGRTFHEVERVVCDSEPARLSSVVRHEASLRRQLSGDLETIVAMAMRKESQRRYASAQRLAEDISRHLKGLPVSARQDTIFYVAGKLVRRNKLATAALVLLFASVAAGWTATIHEMRRSEARFQEVRKLANSLLFELHKPIEKLPGSAPVREHLVRTGLQYLNNLSQDASDDETLQWDLSQAYEIVGDAQGDPDGASLGHFSEALSSYRKSLQLVERLAKRRPDYEVLSCLTWLHYKCGDLELRSAGVDEATNSYTSGIRVAQRVASELKDDRADELLLNGYQRVATARLRVADGKAALKNAEMAVAAADRQRKRCGEPGGQVSVARARLLLANVLWLRGDLHSAWQHQLDAIAWLEAAVERNPGRASYLEDLQDAYRRSGDLQGNPAYFHFGDSKQAERYHRKALQIAEQMASRDPEDAQSQARLSTSLRRLAAVTRAAAPAQAVNLYRRALGILENLAREAPEDFTYRRDMANTRLGLSHALRGTRRYLPAAEQIAAAIAAQRQMLLERPGRDVVREDLFDALTLRSDLYLDLQDRESALKILNEALALAESLREMSPESLYSERCIAIAMQKLAEFHAAAAHGPAAAMAASLQSADEWYSRAHSIWSRWKNENLAVPYSTHREAEIAAARAIVQKRILQRTR